MSLSIREQREVIWWPDARAGYPYGHDDLCGSGLRVTRGVLLLRAHTGWEDQRDSIGAEASQRVPVDDDRLDELRKWRTYFCGGYTRTSVEKSAKGASDCGHTTIMLMSLNVNFERSRKTVLDDDIERRSAEP